jgi:hypothetical protein
MSALATWAAWLATCADSGGSMNGFRGADGAWYYVDAMPRQLQNGAIVGRVHVQRKGEGMADIGAFKIAPDGRVVQFPEEVAALLPSLAPEPPAPERDAFGLEEIAL